MTINERKTVRGSVNINQNYTAKSVCVKGNLNTQENIIAKSLYNFGTTIVKGDCSFEILNNKGTIICNNKIESNKILSSGTLTTKDIKCESFVIGGSVKTEKLYCNEFSGKGQLKVSSILKCDRFEFCNDGRSSIKSIDGNVVHIMDQENYFDKFGKKRISSNNYNQPSKFIVDSINAKRVEVENCVVKKIVCEEIVVGKGCNIDEIVYLTLCNIDNNSDVKSIVRGKNNDK